MNYRPLFRYSAALLLAGVLVSFIAGTLHPAREDPNVHTASFAEYADNATWTAVHLGQFIGMALLIAGLLILYYVLDIRVGTPLWSLRFGAVFAIVTLALYAVLQAVDGVALKHAVDAWMQAPEAEKMARFASAEAVRWLEWAFRSYQSFTLGLSLLLYAVAIVDSARLTRVIGYLMGLSGVAYLVQGWILGVEGFSANNTLPTLLAYLSILVWSIWLLLLAWRMEESVEAKPTPA